MELSDETANPFVVFVLNPAGCQDPALAIAGSRAGGVGIVNAELGCQGINLDLVLQKMRQYALNPYGLKLWAADQPSIDLALTYQNSGLQTLILDLESAQQYGSSLHEFRLRGGRVLIETVAWDDRLRAVENKIDGLWIKGHEAGGWVGEQTSFILLQDFIKKSTLPVFVRGGVNIHSVAACKIGGAAGVVLDDQLLLLRDSPLKQDLAPKLRFYSGLETILLHGRDARQYVRVWALPGHQGARDLQVTALQDDLPINAIISHLGWDGGRDGSLVPPLGQDAAVAVAWTERFGSVAEVLRAIHLNLDGRPRRAVELNILGPGAPLANAHGTRLPIVQGPMTHVSDRVDFIEAVAANGGLPMVAVSLMKGDAVRSLLRETSDRLGERPWGVGLLGFVPSDILKVQREAVRDSKPPFAIIAGGRPDQARELEETGIKTYLHVPSSVLLEQFLEQGSRHFIFEGRECGGHIGPLSSWVLWGRMIDTLLTHVRTREQAESVHVLFAGGIHDARSAAMAATMAVPLVEKGVRVGILMGTGYVFTEEAVASNSITATFQQVAIECTETVGLVTGPGHASRCAITPFVEDFWETRRQLEKDGASKEAIREELEKLSLGRLRLATKGLTRLTDNATELSEVSEGRQFDDGMFMMGQSAAINDRQLTVAELHQSVSEDAISALVAQLQEAVKHSFESGAKPADIAIIGIGCILPKAKNTREYWENILNKVNAIQEIPAARWDWSLYYDSDRHAQDKIYSKWGGFIEDIPFDPVRFGMPPNSVSAIDPMQLLALAVVQQTLADAGYDDRAPHNWETTSVILGCSGGLGEMGIQYGARSEIPRTFPESGPESTEYLPEWTEDSFAGCLPNVAAGRVANRFNFGGTNYIIDAACASSLGSIYHAVLELETGRSDLVLAGGIDTVQGPFAFLCFSKSQALSPSGRCQTFDTKADGIAISEGVAVVALKRLADAERDGDRVYAVIKGVGGSSDGRAKGLTAPLPEGQQRALRRAYAHAGISPATLGLVEAHGTGTVAGDRAELETVIGILQENGTPPSSCAIGSVKTLIGHTKATAGVAGLAKAALALYHKVLPPHFGVTDPNPVLKEEGCPVYLNQSPRPWLRSPLYPRRAGISSFGFGGTNFHAVLEEHDGEYRDWAVPAVRDAWPAEILIWRSSDVPGLVAQLGQMLEALDGGASPSLGDLSKALLTTLPEQGPTLALVARSIADLTEKLQAALRHLETMNGVNPLPSEVYFAREPLGTHAKLAALFSGQGSQYPDMIREVSLTFADVSGTLEEADEILSNTPTFADPSAPTLSRFIYPADCFSPAEEKAARLALTSTDVAQPALGAVEAGVLALMRMLGVEPDMAAGHSYGEYVALYAAGALSLQDLLRVSEARGRFIREATREGELGTMAAVSASRDDALAVVGDVPDLVCANFNGPVQTIISGTEQAIATAIERFQAREVWTSRLPVAAGFHSALMQPAQQPLAHFIEELDWNSPSFPVFANTTAAAYPVDTAEIRSILARHLVEPVNFMGMVEAMYAAGARIFLEIGPKSVLSDLTRSILATRPHLSISTDGNGGGLIGFLNALAALAAHGVPLDFSPLFRGRHCAELDVKRLTEKRVAEPLPKSAYLINGGQAFKPGTSYRTPPGSKAAQSRAASAAGQTVAKGNGAGLALEPATAVPAGVEGQHAQRIASSGVNRVPVSEGVLPDKKGESPLGGHETKNSYWDRLEPGKETEVMPKDADHTSPPVMTAVDPPMMTSVDNVMGEYYKTMRFFLQTQERLMMSYLGGAATGLAATPEPVGQIDYAPTDVLTRGDTYAASDLAASSALFDAEPPSPAPQAPYPTQPAPTVAPAPSVEPPPRPVVPHVVAEPQPEPEPVAAQSTVPASTASAGSEPANGDVDLKGILLRLVSDRTGYPEEMLDLHQNIEADLGIDSIKRVEILGLYQKELPSSLGEALQSEMESLSKASSLQAILDLVASRSEQGSAQRPFDLAGEGIEDISVPLPRYIIEAYPEIVEGVALKPLSKGVYYITPDASGVAEALATRLEHNGVRAAVVPLAAMQDLGALQEWRAAQAAQEPVRAVVHLTPINQGAELDTMTLAAWRDRMALDVKALFPVLQLVADDVSDGGHVIAASAMGGRFGRDAMENGKVRTCFPGSAGAVGLIKSLGKEWEACTCKAVDLDSTLAPAVLAEQIVQELCLPGGRREVGYPNGDRTIFRTVPASLGPSVSTKRSPDHNWVVLAVGGAKGITAETLRDLAKHGLTLVLVGRSPLPKEETEELRACTDANALRRLIIAGAKANGETIRVVDIEKRIQGVLGEREIRANIEDFTAKGARVDYRVADMRQESDVQALLDGVYTDYGRIDAVFFGAGLIEDALLVNKTADSVSRVVDTKVDGAFLLSRYVRPESLRYLTFFTSVAGRYGNRGQSDYGAANETLNRLAWLLQARFGPDVKVSAINWGPWSHTTFGPGMVTPETRRQFEQNGVRLVEPEQGRWLVMQDIVNTPAQDVEIVAGDTPWEYFEQLVGMMDGDADTSRPPDSRFPLLHTGAIAEGDGEVRSLTKTIDLVSDPYLDHHRLDGIPVVPFVCAAEYMAEAAQTLFGGVVTEMRDIRQLRGLTLDDGQRAIQIEVQTGAEPNEVRTQIWSLQGARRLAYSATCILGSELPDAPAALVPDVPNLRSVSVGAAYTRWLFHGPVFQTIAGIAGLNEQCLQATLRPTRPDDFYPPARQAEWLFDPGVLDGALQLVLVWTRAIQNTTTLPTRMERLQRFGRSPLTDPLSVTFDFASDPADPLVRCDFLIVDADGEVRFQVDGFQSVSSAELNRVGGGWAGGQSPAPDQGAYSVAPTATAEGQSEAASC